MVAVLRKTTLQRIGTEKAQRTSERYRLLLDPCREKNRIQRKVGSNPKTTSTKHTTIIPGTPTSSRTVAETAIAVEVRTGPILVEDCATTICTKPTVSITKSASYAEVTTTSRKNERDEQAVGQQGGMVTGCAGNHSHG